MDINFQDDVVEEVTLTECCICLEMRPDADHCVQCCGAYCRRCIARWIQTALTPSCPLCRHPIRVIATLAHEEPLGAAGDALQWTVRLAHAVDDDIHVATLAAMQNDFIWLRWRGRVLAERAIVGLEPMHRAYSLAQDARRFIDEQVDMLESHLDESMVSSAEIIAVFVYTVSQMLDEIEEAVSDLEYSQAVTTQYTLF
jgi:Ring finger domain